VTRNDDDDDDNNNKKKNKNNQGIQTDREVLANRPDILIKNKKDKTCLLIDVAIPSDKNVIQKEDEKKLKYCDILGFPGNATMKRACPHNNEADASRQQSKQKA
jgi:hypothetical protein